MSDMSLPEGQTCGDCVHWRRCSNLIDDLIAVGTSCDFAPSRFRFKPFELQGEEVKS